MKPHGFPRLAARNPGFSRWRPSVGRGFPCAAGGGVQRLPPAGRAHAGDERTGGRAPARQYCTLPVIFITGHGDVPMAVAALKPWRRGFHREAFNDNDLLPGERCLAKERESRDRRRQDAEVSAGSTSHPARARVLDLIIVGKLNKQIADVLGISIKTVEVHRARVMEKMARRPWPKSGPERHGNRRGLWSIVIHISSLF